MAIVHQTQYSTVHAGDCIDVLKELSDESVHAVITDPPYGLSNTTPAQVTECLREWATGNTTYVPAKRGGFMGNDWDSFVPPPAVWEECYRVLKPGGHLLAFAGSRTQDLMGMSVRLAGFDIRDSIGYGSGVVAWMYGTGFPKSHNPGRDRRFCQCEVPDVRDSPAEEAAQPGAEVLRSGVRGGSEEGVAWSEDLHRVRSQLSPQGSLPSSAEQDLLQSVRGKEGVQGEGRPEAVELPNGGGGMRSVRGEGHAPTIKAEADREDLLHSVMPVQSARLHACAACREHEGAGSSTAIRRGQPCMEGRGDDQAEQGELRRPPLREVPGGVEHDGSEGWVHHGTSSCDGSVGRQAVAEDGSGESHKPEPAGQPQGEPGAVSVERGPQAGRGWQVCAGCSKPLPPKGLGSALKPAWEPIILARKPLDGTLAANVLEHGTGAINIDASRIGERFPTNVLLDESQAAVLDEQSGVSKSRKAPRGDGKGKTGVYGEYGEYGNLEDDTRGHNDSGGASRFFYVAKAPKSERPKVDGTAHPTVKPLTLMRHLVRMVTPPGGTVLDPFTGSGTTLEAATQEGFTNIGIEAHADYLQLIAHRLERTPEPEETTPARHHAAA